MQIEVVSYSWFTYFKSYIDTRRFMDEIVPIRRNQSINKYLDRIERFSIQPDIHLNSIPLWGHTFLNWSSGCCSYVDNFDQTFFEGILHRSELLWSCMVLFNKKIILCCVLVFVFFSEGAAFVLLWNIILLLQRLLSI